MPLQPLGVEPAPVTAGYRSLAQLFGFTQGQPVRLVEGEVQFQDVAVQLRTQAFKPDDAVEGIEIAAGDSRAFGPNSPWRLDQMWVRSAGAAFVAAAGWVEV